MKIHPFAFLKQFWNKPKKEAMPPINVYFISGMCYNCKVFDKIQLPVGFNKIYIEWLIPNSDDSLRDYTLKMAEAIDQTKPFVLIGYSFGAVIMQEMNLFLSPLKNVIISSFKAEEEVPTLFKLVQKGGLTEKIPMSFYSSTRFITDTFNRLVYHMPTEELSEYMTVLDPVYIKWAVTQITNWIPENKCACLYHIHGTEDQVFPYLQIKKAFPINGGDHLMVVKRSDEVNYILDEILLIKEG